MKSRHILLILITLFTLFTRTYKLGEVPAGIYPDEESHAYNAYSILKTGKDRYGEKLPVLFRSFGSYQPPVLTYLTIIPVALFGNTVFSARFINAIFAVVLVLITYFILLRFSKNNYKLALISSILVSIAPWSMLFSRLTAEGYLGLTLFILSIFVFVISLKKVEYFPLACFILGISTHAYYSERVISVLFLPLFVLFYNKYFINKKKWLLYGFIVFALCMVPHLMIVRTGALTRRLQQVGYLDNMSIISGFLSKYIIYFSPRNLFFDTGASLNRITPEMGVFYSLLIIPFFLGIKYFREIIDSKYSKLILLLFLITPIPVSLTADSFYPLRALDFIWLISLIVSVGLYKLYTLLPKKVNILVLGALFIYFIFSFYTSYFILFKYEKAFEYVNLINVLKKYNSKEIIIDSTKDNGLGLRLAYLLKYDPRKLQNQLRSQLKTPYYSSQVNLDETYTLDNITVRIANLADYCRKNILIIGDSSFYNFYPDQAKEHNLQFEFDIKGVSGDTLLNAYSTNPNKERCQ